MEKLNMRTGDIANENFRKLAKMFPEAVTETTDEHGEVVRAIDKDVLMQAISTYVVEGNDERYQFTWPDKRKAIRLSSVPVAATLRPCREESVNFDTTENLYIEGDNLDVLKVLRETYLGKVKMIYIDPPYNTGNDFVYEDDFSRDTGDYIANSGQFDDIGNRLVENKESNGRFHTDWLNMIYPRLKVAKDLLSEDGVIFISIDDHEVSNLRKICDEIFGESNYIADLIWDLGTGTTAGHFTRGHEYILCYSRNKIRLPNFVNYNKDEIISHGALKKISNKNPAVKITFPVGFSFEGDSAVFKGVLGGAEKEYILSDKMEFKNGKLMSPTTIEAGFAMRRQIEDFIAGKKVYDSKGQKVNRFYFNSAGILFYEKEKTVINPRTVLSNIANTKKGSSELTALLGDKFFDFPKPSRLIMYITRLLSQSQTNNIILDFFSGSATTAHAVMQLNAEDGGNRKFIMVQLPEICDEKSEAAKAGYKNICEIGKERIRRAGRKIQEELAQKQAEKADDLLAGTEPAPSLDTGFRVLKLDSTNMKEVYYNPAATLQEDLLGRVDNIKEDRTPEDLLFQVMLELGILPSSKIEQSTIAGKQVFNVADNFLLACFEDDVTDEVVTAIAKRKPVYAVLRDRSFASDSVVANFEQIFATYSPDTVRRVL